MNATSTNTKSLPPTKIHLVNYSLWAALVIIKVFLLKSIIIKLHISYKEVNLHHSPTNYMWVKRWVVLKYRSQLID